MKLTIPNIFSLARVAIAPVFFILMLTGDVFYIRISCILFVIGAITDYFDGWLARKYNMVTSWGVFIDPLADKVLTSAAFIGFYILNIVELWMVIIIILRDFGMTAFRLYADSTGSPVVTSKSAKAKTTLQMLFISYILILLFIRENPIFGPGNNGINNLIYSSYTYYTMLILALITLWTMTEYLYQNKKIVKMLFSCKKVKKRFVNEKTFQ